MPTRSGHDRGRRARRRPALDCAGLDRSARDPRGGGAICVALACTLAACRDDAPPPCREITTTIAVTPSSEISAVAWNGTGWAVAFAAQVDAAFEVHLARFSRDGAPLGEAMPITGDPAASHLPALAWSGQAYGVAWQDERHINSEIYFAQVDAAGRRTGGDVRISDADGASTAPAVVWDGAAFVVVWSDERPGGFRLRLARIDDRGVVTPDTELTTGAGDAYLPAVASDRRGHALAFNLHDGAGSAIRFARLAGRLIAGEREIARGEAAWRTPRLAGAGDGFGLSWEDAAAEGSLWFRRLDGLGAPVAPLLDLGRPRVGLGSGALVWTGDGFSFARVDATTTGAALIVGVIDEAGARLGLERTVAGGDLVMRPAMASADGTVALVYARRGVTDAGDQHDELALTLVCP